VGRARSAGDVIEIGTAIVSYIEPHPGQARAFNEWYERDHFPAAVLAGPGVFAGGRFVATKACKAARPRGGRLFGDPERGSYLALAWVLPGHQGEWDGWVAREMDTITAEGRLFAGREHIHTAVYECGSSGGDIPAIAALDRGFAGVIAIAGANLPALATGTTTASAVELSLARTIVSSADPPRHELALLFCDRDPLATFEALELDPLRVDFASPFLATIPGTDTYVDDL
jgi:hypothetical protein